MCAQRTPLRCIDPRRTTLVTNSMPSQFTMSNHT